MHCARQVLSATALSSLEFVSQLGQGDNLRAYKLAAWPIKRIPGWKISAIISKLCV